MSEHPFYLSDLSLHSWFLAADCIVTWECHSFLSYSVECMSCACYALVRLGPWTCFFSVSPYTVDPQLFRVNGKWISSDNQEKEYVTNLWIRVHKATDTFVSVFYSNTISRKQFHTKFISYAGHTSQFSKQSHG